MIPLRKTDTLSDHELAEAAYMWSRGFDTSAIASRLHRRESQVYRALRAIKFFAREYQ